MPINDHYTLLIRRAERSGELFGAVSCAHTYQPQGNTFTPISSSILALISLSARHKSTKRQSNYHYVGACRRCCRLWGAAGTRTLRPCPWARLATFPADCGSGRSTLARVLADRDCRNVGSRAPGAQGREWESGAMRGAVRIGVGEQKKKKVSLH